MTNECVLRKRRKSSRPRFHRPGHVTALVERLGLKKSTVSHHANMLKLLGVVFCQQQGIYCIYACKPSHVQIQSHRDRFAVTVTHPSGIKLTLEVPGKREGNASTTPMTPASG